MSKQAAAPKDPPPETAIAEAIRDKVMNLVDYVLTRNMSDIETVRKRLLALEEPEEMAIALAIKLTAEQVPSASVKLTYSERYTDSVSAPVEDPIQAKLVLP